MKIKISLLLIFVMLLATVGAVAENTVLENPIFESDMESYGEGATKLGGFITGVAGGGYIKAMTVDDNFGKSLVIGTGTASDGYGTYAGLNIAGQGDVTAEFDIRIDGVAEPFTLWLRRVSGGVLTMGHIMADGIAFYGGATEKLPYEARKWYRIKIAMKLSSLTYDVYMTDSENGENIDECLMCSGKALDAACAGGLENLRFVASSQATDGIVALDNIRTYSKGYVPEIASFGYDETESADKMIYNAHMLRINLSHPVSAETASQEYISCVSENGDEAPLGEISLSQDGRTIMCELTDSLYSNLAYTVTLKSGMKAGVGIPFGEEVTGSFTVKEKPLDVTAASFSLNGSTLTVKPRIVNSSGDTSKNIWIAIVSYKGKEIKAVKLEKYNASKRLATPSFTVDFNEGETVEVYALDSMVWANLINSTIYKYPN